MGEIMQEMRVESAWGLVVSFLKRLSRESLVGKVFEQSAKEVKKLVDVWGRGFQAVVDA